MSHGFIDRSVAVPLFHSHMSRWGGVLSVDSLRACLHQDQILRSLVNIMRSGLRLHEDVIFAETALTLTDLSGITSVTLVNQT